MADLDRLRRGSLSQQFFRGADGHKLGPYHVLQGYFEGKKFSRRIPAAEVAQVAADVANYQRFQALAETFVTLSEQMTHAQDGRADAKKNSKRRRSPRRSSKRPPPS